MHCTQHKDNIGDLCIPDSGTTHTILKNRYYFSEIKPTKAVVKIIYITITYSSELKIK